MYNNTVSQSPISLPKALTMYVLVSLFLFFEMAVQVSPSVMAPQLMHDLNMTALGLGIMSGCYFYTYTAMQIPSGLLFDRFDARLVIVASILFCAIGSLLMGFSSNIFYACISRLLIGLGSAFAFVSVLVVTADLFEAKHFATLTGITQMLAALGAMSGQLPVSILVNSLGWRQTMFMFAIVGLLIAIGVYCFLRYEKHPREYKQETQHKILPQLKTIFAQKQTWFLAIYACLLWAPMSGFTSLWGVSFLVNVDGLSQASAAFFTSIMWLGLAIASPLLGHFSTQMRSRKIPLSLSALIGAAAFGCIVIMKLQGWMLLSLLLLAGAACAGQALSFTVVKENNAKSVSATAMAFNNMAVVISGAIFQPLIGWLLNNLHFSVVMQYRIAISLLFFAYITAFIMATFFIKEPTPLNAR